MKTKPLLALALFVAPLIALSACSVTQKNETPKETVKPVQHEFRAVTNWVDRNENPVYILLAPSGVVNKTADFTGEVVLSGSCLGMKRADDGAIFPVIWPADSTVLTTKIAVEFKGNYWNPVREEWISSQVRAQRTNELYTTGEFVTESSLLALVPESCPVPKEGVFLMAAANHPKTELPEVEEEEDTAPEQGQNPSD